jgi:hypothetical protein
MHSLEPEIRTLHAAGELDDAAAARALASERRTPFSLHDELRTATWAGVLLVTGGVGVLVARNLDRIGPLALAVAIALAALACYAYAARGRRPGEPPSGIVEYVLLLGALLLSADLAYVERQFGVLGPSWPWHLLLLATLHALAAYAYASTLLLAASLAALAGWFGVGSPFGGPFDWNPDAVDFGRRALTCAAIVGAWRVVDRRLRPATRFTATFDHFAANLAFWGGLAWCLRDSWLYAGLALVAVLAPLAVRHGLHTGREAFVVYGVGYAALALCFAFAPRIGASLPTLTFVLLVVAGAATLLWQLHGRLKEPPA